MFPCRFDSPPVYHYYSALLIQHRQLWRINKQVWPVLALTVLKDTKALKITSGHLEEPPLSLITTGPIQSFMTVSTESEDLLSIVSQ